jgi:hypothetical protein
VPNLLRFDGPQLQFVDIPAFWRADADACERC